MIRPVTHFIMRFLVIASLIAITYSAELKSITTYFTLLRVSYIFEFQFVIEIKENFDYLYNNITTS